MTVRSRSRWHRADGDVLGWHERLYRKRVGQERCQRGLGGDWPWQVSHGRTERHVGRVVAVSGLRDLWRSADLTPTSTICLPNSSTRDGYLLTLGDGVDGGVGRRPSVSKRTSGPALSAHWQFGTASADLYTVRSI